MKKQNKITIIFLIFILLVMTVTKSYGAIGIEQSEKKYTLPNLPNKIAEEYLVFKKENNFYLMTFEKEKDTFACILRSHWHAQNNILPLYFAINNSRSNFLFFSCKENDSLWIKESNATYVFAMSNSTADYFIDLSKVDLIGSSVDIKNEADGTIFFQKTPIILGVIPKVETVQQMTTAIKETLTMIIPIGLTILLVGLGIFVIKSVISQST